MPTFELDYGHTVEVDVIETFPNCQTAHVYQREGEFGLTHISYTKFKGEKLIVQCISHESLRPEVIERRKKLWQDGAAKMAEKTREDILMGRRTAEEVESTRAAFVAKFQVLETVGEAPWPY